MTVPPRPIQALPMKGGNEVLGQVLFASTPSCLIPPHQQSPPVFEHQAWFVVGGASPQQLGWLPGFRGLAVSSMSGANCE